MILLARWARSLAATARISPGAHAAVARCLERTLSAAAEDGAGEPGAPPRDLAKLLELLFELRSEVRSGPLPEATCTYLEALPDAGRLVSLKRALRGEPPATHPRRA